MKNDRKHNVKYGKMNNCMQHFYLAETKWIEYVAEEYKEHLKFIKIVLANTDKVCFSVSSYMDDIEELKKSIWASMSDSVLYTMYDVPIAEGMGGSPRQLVVLKNDYTVYDFFRNRKNIFDFEEDINVGYVLEDPMFIKGDKIVCFSVTHELGCCMTEELYLQMHCHDNDEQ